MVPMQDTPTTQSDLKTDGSDTSQTGNDPVVD